LGNQRAHQALICRHVCNQLTKVLLGPLTLSVCRVPCGVVRQILSSNPTETLLAMSKSFTDLLTQTQGAEEATKTKLLPPARFTAKISSYDILPRFWKAKGDKPDRAAQCYSATFELVDYFPTGDEDRDQFTLDALEKFGDWRGKKLSSNGRGVIESKGPDKILMVMGIGPGVYGLLDTDPTFTTSLGYSAELKRFVKTDDTNAVVGGFVSVLSKEPSAMVPIDLPPAPVDDAEFQQWLQDLIAATEDTYVVLEVGIREYTREGSTTPEEAQELVGISSVA
jgi:hypothetical protein